MIVYKIGEKIYINLTNKCSNACTFCVRNTSDEYTPYSLWLKQEPSVEDVIESLNEYLGYREYVFCGYGEPLYRLDAIEEIAAFLKYHKKTVRINTNGQADLICGLTAEEVAEKLKDCVDIVSISLNETDAESYDKICRCRFGQEGYYSMLRFASACVKAGINVVMSVVDVIGKEKIAKAREIAEGIGAKLRVRELIK